MSNFLFICSLPKLSDFCSERSNGILLKQPTESSYPEVICSFWGPNPNFEFVPTKATEYFPLHLAGVVGNECILRSNDIFIILHLFYFPNPWRGTDLLALSIWSLFNCLVGLFSTDMWNFHKNWGRYPFFFPSTNPCQMQIFWGWYFFTEHYMVFLVHTFLTLNIHM